MTIVYLIVINSALFCIIIFFLIMCIGGREKNFLYKGYGVFSTPSVFVFVPSFIPSLVPSSFWVLIFFLLCSLFVNVVYYNTHLLLFLFGLFIIVVCFCFSCGDGTDHYNGKYNIKTSLITIIMSLGYLLRYYLGYFFILLLVKVLLNICTLFFLLVLFVYIYGDLK